MKRMDVKVKKKLVSGVTLLLLLGVMAGCGTESTGGNEMGETPNESNKIWAEENVAEPKCLPNTVQVGEYVTFGTYEQDNDTANGSEDIEWVVLDIQQGKALLLSRHCLEWMIYDEENGGYTWEKVILRTWLNEEFYNTAFTAEEKGGIVVTYLENKRNEHYATEGGNPTEDKVFLLSLDEANAYFKENEERECPERTASPTAYAIAKGARFSEKTGNGEWMLRTPGNVPDLVCYVLMDGGISEFGRNIFEENGVRPAMWVTVEQ